MSRSEMDFDRALAGERVPYTRGVGRWWRRRSDDSAHAYAYRKIAEKIGTFIRRDDPMIVDYGCGTGQLLALLHRRYPQSSLMGVDGSSLMLGVARERFLRTGSEESSPGRFVRKGLPDFSLPLEAADIVVFTFPHIICDPGRIRRMARRFRREAAAARYLVKTLKFETEGGAPSDEDDPVASLFLDRMISRNLRGMLKPGGVCVRVEYGEAGAGELTELEELISGFEEGSLTAPINQVPTEQYFEVSTCEFYRSGVIRDVFEQTQDTRYEKGGYFITVLKAV